MAALPLDLPLEYVRLGLRFDRLESGFVDAYTGDPRLRAEVADEQAPTPSGLRDQARALLRELDAADLAAERSEYLRGQLTGLECTARKMSGEPVGFVDEVAAYFQVDVVLGDPAEYAAAHAELGALLPGDGTLAERYAAHRRREECPPDRLESAVHALSSALRDRVRGQYGLPEVETVHVRGGHRQAVVGVQLLRGRLPLPGRDQRRPAAPALAAAAPGGARVLPRSPHRALPQGARPGGARRPGPSTPSSWSTPPSA